MASVSDEGSDAVVAERPRPLPKKSTACPLRTPGRQELVRVIEALLFVGNEPLDPSRITAAFPTIKTADFVQAIRRLSERYERQQRPYVIRRAPDGYVLELKQRYRDEIRSRTKVDRGVRLPRPVVEVLSLVAYRQPIDRAEIEKMLGYDPSAPLRQLLRRGLIAKQPHEKGASPPFVTTERFLELFRIESLEELPSSEELS